MSIISFIEQIAVLDANPTLWRRVCVCIEAQLDHCIILAFLGIVSANEVT
jgi:hypothetical protein